jgi:hypothetical protein
MQAQVACVYASDAGAHLMRGRAGSFDRECVRTRVRKNCDETRSSGRRWWVQRHHASTTRVVDVACLTSGGVYRWRARQQQHMHEPIFFFMTKLCAESLFGKANFLLGP